MCLVIYECIYEFKFLFYVKMFMIILPVELSFVIYPIFLGYKSNVPSEYYSVIQNDLRYMI